MATGNAQSNRNIRSILIVGGGSAGWMAAAALANQLSGGVSITLVESDEIGTVGVGEATIPPIKMFNQQLGINEREFVEATQGSFKLGIEFVDWSRKGASYIHPFGTYGAQFDSVPLHYHWLRQRALGNDIPIEQLSLGCQLARGNKFLPPSGDARMIQSTSDYAYHFDAGLYARFLRHYAETRGVTRVEGKIVDVTRMSESGYIASLTLDNGATLEADFFIDCSGFRALLIGQTLGSDFVDWSHWLPCDSAQAVPCDFGANHEAPFTPYTRSTARAAGWQWRIPLQHRIGNGHVYVSNFISDDEAAATLMNNLDGRPLTDPRPLRFKAGHRREFWKGNCVALGLASGFLEPLESTSLHLMQSSIARLITLFPNRDFHPAVIAEFNRVTREEYETTRDFIILHYKATTRDDSELWRYTSSMQIPDSLAWKMEHWKSFGRLASKGPELFQNASWLAVYTGQEIWPDLYDPTADYRPQVDAAARLEGIRRVIREVTEAAPTHSAFIAHHCPAPKA